MERSFGTAAEAEVGTAEELPLDFLASLQVQGRCQRHRNIHIEARQDVLGTNHL